MKTLKLSNVYILILFIITLTTTITINNLESNTDMKIIEATSNLEIMDYALREGINQVIEISDMQEIQVNELTEQLNDITERIEQLEIYYETQRITDIEHTNASRIKYTQEELDSLEMLVQHEVGAESYTSKLLVASIIINRVNDTRYPNNLNDIIYQTDVINGKTVYQFSPIIKGLYKTPSKDTKLAVQEALIQDFSGGAWIFNNKSITDPKIQEWFEQFEIVAEYDDVQYRR